MNARDAVYGWVAQNSRSSPSRPWGGLRVHFFIELVSSQGFESASVEWIFLTRAVVPM